MFGLNPRSHLSLLTLMMLMGNVPWPPEIHGVAPKCQRIRKSAAEKAKRKREKAARRKQRRMN